MSGLGVLYGISTALIWGLGYVIVKSQAGKWTSINLLLVRALAGGATAFLFYLFIDTRESLLHLAPSVWFLIIGSVLTGFWGADFVFIVALKDLPLSYLFPIQASYPLFAAGLAWLFLGDVVTFWTALGAVLVLSGISLIGSEEKQPGSIVSKSIRKRGFVLATLSAFGWGVSTVLLESALEDHDPITINAGVGVLTALCFLAVSKPREALSFFRENPRSGGAVSIAGSLGGTGLANLFFLLAIGALGAAQAAILSSITPLFTAIFAVLFLHEKLTSKLSLGTILTVAGVMVLIKGG